MGNELIPFGKYKGQPVEQLQSDPDYAKWLIQQPWFADRYSNIRTLVINNYKEAEESPEHNVMQARFLDDYYMYNVLCAARAIRPFHVWETDTLVPYLRGMKWCNGNGQAGVIFEHEGWDVVAFMYYDAEGENLPPASRRKSSIEWGCRLYFELKPSLGEEFPAVLRQVKARKRDAPCCVMVDRFIAESVSYEDVHAIFRNSNIKLLQSGSVIPQQIPHWMLGHKQQVLKCPNGEP